MSDLKNCPHDKGKLEAYDPAQNLDKAGRVYCAECGCSFRDEDLATRGANCAFFAPAAEAEEAEEAVAEAPEGPAEEPAEETEEDTAPRRRGR